MNILLGIDIGTSACKTAAFSENGRILAQAAEEYPTETPARGWAQQDPDLWWAAVCNTIKEVLEKVPARDIAGIGIDGQSWSAIPVNKNGEVLCPTPIWMDTRASEICDRLKEEIGEDKLFSVSGNPLQPTYTLPKILWYKKHLPQVYNRTYKILQSNSFIAYRLTGEMTQDISQGYGLSCFNMEKGQWDTALCAQAGIPPDILPDLFPSHRIIGGVTESAAALTGLIPGTPVAAGGLDAACGTLGAGVIHSGEVQEQGGQAGGMSICMDRCVSDKRLILGRHVVPGLWLLQGGSVGGGGAVKWFMEQFGKAYEDAEKSGGGTPFFLMDREAEKIPAGSGGLLFLPYMAGERSPIWDPSAKGVFYGIDFAKTQAHFARAVMEGVAYSLLHNLKTAEESGVCAGILNSMGGAANSRLWTQIKADVTGKKIHVPSADTATSLGAAILAGVGTGIYGSFDEAVSKTVTIKRTHYPRNREVYEKGYNRYLELYTRLKPMMNEY